MNKEKEIRFSCKREEIPVTLENLDGTESRWFLREMTGSQRDSYLTSMGDRMKVGPKGEIIGVKNFDGIQASLLALCLYDENGKMIPVGKIQEIRSTVLGELYKLAQKINGLEEEAVENAKNE